MRILQAQKDVTVVSKNGNEMNLQKVSMRFEDMLVYRQTVINDLQDILRNLDIFTADCR